MSRLEEVSEIYEGAMRNVLAAAPSVCAGCHTLIDADRGFSTCFRCGHDPAHIAAVVPITYSVNLGQMHTVLRGYKDGYHPAERQRSTYRLAAVLLRFLLIHEPCVAKASGAGKFDVITSVPSSTAERDERGAFRELLSYCGPLHNRTKRVLVPTGKAASNRDFNPIRYKTTEDLAGANVLLLDDTWTTGGHAQSAACALRTGGAAAVALVVIGRHITPEWPVGGGKTAQEAIDALPPFDWDTCCVH